MILKRLSAACSHNLCFVHPSPKAIQRLPRDPAGLLRSPSFVRYSTVPFQPAKMIELDGQTGEGGGQLVRIAVALASVTSEPVRITNVRGNRPGGRGGGLKSQHVTAIEWLATATNANVKGLEVGSTTLEFSPNRGPGQLQERNITITAASPAASALLIFQAVFPFLLFAGSAKNEPIELTISGGTNVSFSLSYEYLDQVLLPALEAWFGARVERRIQQRGWSTGRASRGSLWFKIYPLPVGTTLQLKEDLAESLAKRSNNIDVDSIEVTIITPSDLHAPLEACLREDLETLFPDAQLNFRPSEESGHEARIYVLAVAQSSSSNMRWGRDCLYNRKRKGKKVEVLCREISTAVTKDLAGEIHRGGVVDEFLQDQLVVFQALAEGQTSFPRYSVASEQSDTSQKGDDSIEELDQELRGLYVDNSRHRLKKCRCRGPLGDAESDSSHTQTARWVAWEVLEPRLTWFNQGVVCEGIGLRSGS